MKTVKLHWIESQKNDLMTKDTYAIAGSKFNVTQNSFLHDAEEYILPNGYDVFELKDGDIGIFDERDMYCEIDRYHRQPILVSSTRIISLQKK